MLVDEKTGMKLCFLPFSYWLPTTPLHPPSTPCPTKSLMPCTKPVSLPKREFRSVWSEWEWC